MATPTMDGRAATQLAHDGRGVSESASLEFLVFEAMAVIFTGRSWVAVMRAWRNRGASGLTRRRHTPDAMYATVPRQLGLNAVRRRIVWLMCLIVARRR